MSERSWAKVVNHIAKFLNDGFYFYPDLFQLDLALWIIWFIPKRLFEHLDIEDRAGQCLDRTVVKIPANGPPFFLALLIQSVMQLNIALVSQPGLLQDLKRFLCSLTLLQLFFEMGVCRSDLGRPPLCARFDLCDPFFNPLLV